ncbi:MAG TPA: 3-deoxy-D-manno-octulosonic acid transferase [Candidatus Binatia bacterium]|nr:3-deoxy-D-manno-octulosonic acid transferase [Candidatus Binatia bacterium]
MISFYSFLYSLALGAAMLLSLPYWLFQMLRHGKYRRGLAERLGAVPSRLELPRENQRSIWIHAVSVGEVFAIAGLVEELGRRLPQHRILISTTTDTGQALARKRFGESRVFYFPLDFAFAIRPYMRALHPELIVLAETEFWPNFLRLSHAEGKVAVVNGRISDRSWPRYRRFRPLVRKLLANVDLFLAQTGEDASRLRDIGAAQNRVRVGGNLKFDIAQPAPPAIVEQLRQALAGTNAAPVLVCGSTVEGEEALLLKAFENVLAQYPRAAMILAPRHPERFAEVEAILKQMSLKFVRRSEWGDQDLAGGVFLLDTLGELSAIYALADVAFVGGSLVPRGGHNIIEPAQHGVAIMVGHHTENFRDIVTLFQRNDAVRIVGPAELPLTLLELLADVDQRKAMGERAAATIQAQTGATARTAQELLALLAPARQ